MAGSCSSMPDAFEQLQDNKSKIKALDELFEKLTHDEIRFLKVKISNVDFRCDPIDKLPFEICYQIFQHLEAYQIFQAQRVSWKWYETLSSPEIVEPLTLRPWLDVSEMSSGTSKGSSQGTLVSQSDSLAGGKTSLQVKHIDSFRNGTAFSMAKGNWPKEFDNQLAHIEISYEVAFAGSILAWVDSQAGFILLRCVISGQRVGFYTPARRTINVIAISKTTIIALTFSGKLYAWDLSDGLLALEGQAPYLIETYTDALEIVKILEGVVVVMYRSSDRMVNFTTWDMEARQLHAFQMQIKQGSFEVDDYLVTSIAGSKSIIFFERSLEKTKYVNFTRMNLNGQIESSGCMEHPDIEGYSQISGVGAPVCTGGKYITLWAYAGPRELLDGQLTEFNMWEIMRVVYDTDSDKLELQRHIVKNFIPTKVPIGDVFWWKDIAFLANRAHRPEAIEVLDLKASVCKYADMSLPEGSESSKMHPGFLLGNESFLVSARYVQLLFDSYHPSMRIVKYSDLMNSYIVSHRALWRSLATDTESHLLYRTSGYTVWCFEDIKLADEDPEYRVMMRKKKKARLE